MKDKPLKITEYSDNGIGKTLTKVILLLKVKDTEKWKFVNLTKGHVCPCEFSSQEEALKDFLKYFDKFYKVIFEEFNPNKHIM